MPNDRVRVNEGRMKEGRVRVEDLMLVIGRPPVPVGLEEVPGLDHVHGGREDGTVGVRIVAVEFPYFTEVIGTEVRTPVPEIVGLVVSFVVGFVHVHGGRIERVDFDLVVEMSVKVLLLDGAEDSGIEVGFPVTELIIVVEIPVNVGFVVGFIHVQGGRVDLLLVLLLRINETMLLRVGMGVKLAPGLVTVVDGFTQVHGGRDDFVLGFTMDVVLFPYFTLELATGVGIAVVPELKPVDKVGFGDLVAQLHDGRLGVSFAVRVIFRVVQVLESLLRGAVVKMTEIDVLGLVHVHGGLEDFVLFLYLIEFEGVKTGLVEVGIVMRLVLVIFVIGFSHVHEGRTGFQEIERVEAMMVGGAELTISVGTTMELDETDEISTGVIDELTGDVGFGL